MIWENIIYIAKENDVLKRKIRKHDLILKLSIWKIFVEQIK